MAELRCGSCPCHADEPQIDFWDHCQICEPVDDLEHAVRIELLCLWGDMDEASRRSLARDGQWSIGMLNLAERIQALSQFVGPVPWGYVNVSVLRARIYEQVYEDVDYPPIDWRKVEYVEQRIRESAL